MRADECLAQSLVHSVYSVISASPPSQLAQVGRPGRRAFPLPGMLSCTEVPQQVMMLQAFPLPKPWEMSAKQTWGAEDREAERPSAMGDLDPNI